MIAHRTGSPRLLAAAFLLAGCIHVARPGIFLSIMPGWVPMPRATVILTGWCEIAGALGLMLPRFRWWAGTMLALYTVCVFPANIKHALDYGHAHGFGRGWLYHGPRLLLQPLIVWWCLHAGNVVDWPFGGSGRAAPSRPGDHPSNPDRRPPT